MTFAADALTAKTALVVDDGPVERMAGKALLEKLGFLVTTADTGEDALHLLRQHPTDLVLCDISMPGMGGLALLEATRGQPCAPAFIMSTSHDDAEHAEASMRSGAHGYLVKPLRFTVLRQMVSEVLSAQGNDGAGCSSNPMNL